MDQFYRETVGRMEAAGVDPNYVLIRQGGHLGQSEARKAADQRRGRVQRKAPALVAGAGPRHENLGGVTEIIRKNPPTPISPQRI